jgi:hypothetical protein
MMEELEKLRAQLERLRTEYAMEYDISHAVNRLAEEIDYWMECQKDD